MVECGYLETNDGLPDDFFAEHLGTLQSIPPAGQAVRLQGTIMTETITETAPKRVLITDKEIVGQMANWAIRQHPYGRPEGLFDVTDTLTAAAQKWPDGIESLKMMEADSWVPIEVWLRSALHENPILAQWNTPKSGHTRSVFVSRYSGPRPEDDFIDIDALLRNVALSAYRNARDEAAL